ncbi:MAG: rhomboid family intramembrane serine protease [Pseudomonadota bacterium]
MKHVLYRAPLDEDLRPLSVILWRERIAHRIAEEAGGLVVELAPDADRERATALLGQWQDGRLQVVVSDSPRGTIFNGGSGSSSFLLTLRRVPITSLLLGLSMLGFALVYLNAPLEILALLTYEPFAFEGGSPVFSAANGQYWRLVTPVFLHFGWLHITFNSLWCWDLGRRIEMTLGSLNMAGLFLLTAIVGNVAQNLWAGSVLFGGLSGVVYGLLGFSWCAGFVNSRWQKLQPPGQVVFLMLLWLGFCLLDVSEVLGFSVANAAHLGGLLSGCLAGLVFGFGYQRS